MSYDFWQGRRVLVTGHTGFKGGWLSLWLKRLGAEVSGLSLEAPTEPNLFTLARIDESLAEHRIGDIRDQAVVESVLRAAAPEIIFHLAAQPIVLTSYADPVGTYATNVMGTVNVLDSVRRVGGVKATVIVTSDKCYENREMMWAYREHDPMGGYDPYSSSKGCAELATSAFARSFFDNRPENGSVASARAGNVIGGGDWAPHRLVVDLIRGLIAGERIVIRHPAAVRPWQHVLEPLSGYLRLAEQMVESPSAWEGWNFGPDDTNTQTVLLLARRLCGLWGTPDALDVTGNLDQPHEAGLLKLDSTKARVRLGWHPTWGFDETLQQTVAWYRAYASGCDMRDFTLRQIEVYENAARRVSDAA